ncbi:MAG: BamA/TamA family outer membrane protein, partial [Deltaproteobacteria bacterium]|nr:BamA/TamA family outer membrane protein [Deltaproteobacteria bacterium]
AFYNEAFGFAAGFAYGKVGYHQKQSALLCTVMVGSKGSIMGFLIGRDLRLPWSDRLFLDPMAQVGYFNDAESYTDGNPNYPDERAGTNDSDEDNFIEGDGWDNFFRPRFKYLLPVGHAKDTIINTYVVDRGLLKSGATGGKSWNPLTSGRTYFELLPFYRWQEIKGNDDDVDIKTNGLEFSLFRDNRDFVPNPSQGSALRVDVTRDFHLFNSSDSWTVVQTEFDKYFSLGPSKTFRQRVIAFDFWTAYSPTWDVEGVTDDGQESISNRPPSYAGATLGGIWRMRGYPAQRFSDKAGIYYALEYRMIPKWNPFNNWPWLQEYVGIEWLQFVPFVEVGRVAPSWNFKDLHSDMKWDAGLGLRFWAKGLVARVDVAGSDEGVGVAMMVSQPFQF